MNSAVQADDVRYDGGAATVYENLGVDDRRLLVAGNTGERDFMLDDVGGERVVLEQSL